MLERCKTITRACKREIKVYRVSQDRRTPWTARALLALALGYARMPFDLIPHFLSVIGRLDDAIMVPALIIFALTSPPPEILRGAVRGSMPK